MRRFALITYRVEDRGKREMSEEEAGDNEDADEDDEDEGKRTVVVASEMEGANNKTGDSSQSPDFH